ncbi:MAG: lysophospholipid acyltransferase family protein [Gemmatimonadaceae bacterium]|nr:lysophospholipid acyltransferase family protein [Gemmatimonadaceae bacterium]
MSDDTSSTAGAMKKERRARWVSAIAGVGVRLLARTWRVREVHQGKRDIVRQHEQPVIFCLWHCELLCLMWNFRKLGIVVLISEHGDGEIASRAAESMGYRTIRGSSRRGAERALLALAREVEGGAHVAVTPDGPRGPAESFAPGALIAAERSGAPIVLLRAVADRAWRLNSWDRFIIPKPFARLTIYIGEPVFVRTGSLRDAASESPTFQALMRELPVAAGG